MRGLKRGLLCGTMLAAGLAGAASAQDATVGEIVVTGQKRASTVQDTAAAINVISAEQLAATGTTTSVALQFATPGLNISQDLGLQTQIFIRGIGSNLQGVATGNSVATYLDGVYIPNSIQSAQQFMDVERVEVLKGPQATLYGRNATGGAITIVTRAPGFAFEGAGDISYGNFDAVQARLRVNIPLVQDRLAFSLAAQSSEHEGYARNLFTGNKLAYDRVKGVRAALRGVVTDDLEVILRADYTDVLASDVYKLFPSTSVYYYTAPNTRTDFSAGPQWFSPDPRAVYYDVDPRNPGYDRGVSATVKWKSPLGDVTSVTSKRQFNAGPYFADSDQTPAFPLVFGVKLNTLGSKQESDSFYHETYLTTDLQGPLNLIVGGTYFYDAGYAKDRSTTSRTDAHARTKAWSVYVDGGLDLSETLRLVGGVRYSEEEKSYEYRRVFPAGATDRNQKTFTSTNPRIGLEWRPRPGLLAFATATSGFKSGGFNPSVASNAFNPEEVWSYEAGLKTRLLDGLARLATSAFYYDYSDIQVLQYLTITQGSPPVATLVQNITNGASAKIYGWDIEGDIAATANLTLGGGLSLLHTEFGSTIFCDPLIGSCTNATPALRPNIDVEGNSLARAPDVSANLYAEYEIPLDLPGRLKVRVDGSYRGKTYYTVFENDYYSTDGYWLLGGNIRYDADDGWFAELYGNNLADELAITNIINSSPYRNSATGALIVGSPARFERYAPPRTFGLRVGVKF